MELLFHPEIESTNSILLLRLHHLLAELFFDVFLDGLPEDDYTEANSLSSIE